jgi:multiple sugar transport system substrate-binding protein
LDAAGILVVLIGGLLTGCGGGGQSGIAKLTWYINPDNGGQKALAQECGAASGGHFRIVTSLLPNDATSQREQLVRRLAAKDASIDLMSLDPPFVAEFAQAGFLRPFRASEVKTYTDGILAGPVTSAMWKGRLVAAPFWANTQLLWYRKSIVTKTGVDPTTGTATWGQLVNAAAAAGKTFEVQAGRYEGYMVWINALVSSAGGTILRNPQAGRNAQPAVDSPAGRTAASVIRDLAHSKAADPGIATAQEEPTRNAFQSDRGGFMVNWPYVYGAAQAAVLDGSLTQAVVDDIGWARYPRVESGQASRPPLGGINLGVGAFGKHPTQALAAVRCITSAKSQAEYMLSAKNPAARASVYDQAEVRKAFPMADLIRSSIDDGAPRPQTPYYTDVSAAVVREFHPPGSVQPTTTPARAARLIVEVLHDRVLL